MANTVKRNESSPSVKRGGKLGSPALNPIGLQQANQMPYGNYLDPNQALQEVEHPSAKWAGVELQQCKPRN